MRSKIPFSKVFVGSFLPKFYSAGIYRTTFSRSRFAELPFIQITLTMLCMNSKPNSHCWMAVVSKETCWEGLLKILHHQVVIDFLFHSLLQPWISCLVAFACRYEIPGLTTGQELEHFKISKNSYHLSSRESSWIALPFRKYPNPKWSSNSQIAALNPSPRRLGRSLWDSVSQKNLNISRMQKLSRISQAEKVVGWCFQLEKV